MLIKRFSQMKWKSRISNLELVRKNDFPSEHNPNMWIKLDVESSFLTRILLSSPVFKTKRKYNSLGKRQRKLLYAETLSGLKFI